MTNRDAEQPEDPDPDQGIGATPPPGGRRRRPSLHDAAGIKAELIRLYKDARAGKVPPGDASRLGNLLELLRRGHETAELANRLEALERILQQRTPSR